MMRELSYGEVCKVGYGFNAAEVFRVAIQVEENGRRFYEESRKNIESAEIKELLYDLSQQEIAHKTKFETLLAELPCESKIATVWDPQNEIDQYIGMMAADHVFVSSQEVEDRVSRLRDAADALKLAIEFEKDSIIFFLSFEDAMSRESDRQLIKSLIKEEQEHLRRLTLELRKITNKRIE
ncbi:MAG TPA: ferritin family protein [Syntrophobacteraceae bacterium]|nr:ferritin family protein [Syntrophobacteraceae bacterium]